MTVTVTAPDLAALRHTVTSGSTAGLDWRRAQLGALRRLLVEHEAELVEAVAADVGKPRLEARLTETYVSVEEIDHLLAHLEEWTAPRPVSLPLTLRPARAHVQLQPKGVVLVIAPWNYPLNLLVSPVAGALAAGNTVVLKPSEHTPRLAALVERLVPQYFPADVARVVTGGVEETTALLEQRFDHIFFTGSGRVGRIVMRAAAEHLTPVTLELGGKSPTFVDDSVDLAVAARRIVWGKFTNAGQTCVAPDHVLVTRTARDRMLAELVAAVHEFFGDDPRRSPDLGRIVGARQHARLVELLEGAGGTVVVGGQHDADERYLAPTVVADVDPDAPIMQEEIFGPVLPVVTVADHQQAIEQIASRDHPLALYVFSEREEVREAFTRRTTSGGMAFGATVVHVGAAQLPFGGVGASGMGSYHGRASVEELSHHRSVLDKPLGPDTLRVLYPPFDGLKGRLVAAATAPGRAARPAAVVREGMQKVRGLVRRG
ncbi:aldehyde dehydrogenase [Ornithinimicrobium sp. CNJ-824]|uniref:aldehyde dehydrogenase family protein n=1 Tax=Ornithinimicrobium sp. CNJ-824 TaxID=1904966 RepID=UPI000966377C|nr:aldehyde dehydrogenase family protein [Ornithinimicrobium sp. CNJ-824]OLT23311.1 aldehyde dehydrogenase [Ornithinimicrobium sp. CNJ-824]